MSVENDYRAAKENYEKKKAEYDQGQGPLASWTSHPSFASWLVQNANRGNFREIFGDDRYVSNDPRRVVREPAVDAVRNIFAHALDSNEIKLDDLSVPSFIRNLHDSYRIEDAHTNIGRAIRQSIAKNPQNSINFALAMGHDYFRGFTKDEHDQFVNGLIEHHNANRSKTNAWGDTEAGSLLNIYFARHGASSSRYVNAKELFNMAKTLSRSTVDSAYAYAPDTVKERLADVVASSLAGGADPLDTQHSSFIHKAFMDTANPDGIEKIANHIPKNEDILTFLENPRSIAGLGHIPDSVIKRLAADDALMTANPRWKKDFEKQISQRGPLGAAAKFWRSYEEDVEPEHFAVGRSLYTNKPEVLTDHRGDTGTSEPHMELLPHLREYAKKTQDAITEKIQEGKLKGFQKNGKWYVTVYRGVSGNHAEHLVKNVLHPRQPLDQVLTSLTPFAVKDTTARFPTSHISSWSVDKRVAQRFAQRDINGHQNSYGIIMEAAMPVSHILHSGFMDMYAGQDHAHPDESELIFHHPGDKPMQPVHAKNMSLVVGRTVVPAVVVRDSKPQKESPELGKSEDIVKMLHNDNTDGVHHAFQKQDFNSTEDKVSHVQKLHEVAHSVAFDPNARASFIRHLVRTDDTHALKMVLEDTGVSGFHKLAKDFDQLTGSDFRLYVMNNIVAKPEVLETDNPAFGDIVEDAVAHHANSLDAILSPLTQAPKVTNLYVLSALANTAYAEHPDKMFEELKVPVRTVYKLPAKAQMGFIVHNIKAQDMHNKYDVVKMADALHESMGDAFANKLKEQLKDVPPTNPLLLSVKRSKDKHGLEDHLTVKAGSGVLRKLRDHLLSAGDISPNDLPEGRWNSLTKKVGKATVADWEPLLEKNGKLSADKVQDCLDRIEGTTYGFSLSTTPEGETVFNLKIPKHELNKLHATGADETLKRLVHLSQGSGNPIEDRTIGWMKFKNNEDGHMEVTEVQSDLDMDMADTLRKQMEQEYGTVDEGEYGRHLEKLHAIYPPAHLHQLQGLVFKGRPSADVIREAFHEYARKNGMVGKKTDGQEVRKNEKGAA
jgi:hypothetical protein